MSIFKNKDRYVIVRQPVTNTRTGRVLGWIVRLSDGTSHFEAAVRVRPGARVNMGL